MPEKIEAMTPALGMLTGFLQSLTQEKKDMEAMELQKQKDQASMWRTVMPVMMRERGETARFEAEQTAKLEQFMADITSKEKLAGKEYELGFAGLELKMRDLEFRAFQAGEEMKFDTWKTEFDAKVQKALKGLDLSLEEYRAEAGLKETMEEIAGRKEVSEAEIKGRADVSAKETAATERMATEAVRSKEDMTNWQIDAAKDLAELAKEGKLTDIEQSEVDAFDREIDRALRLQISVSEAPENIMLAESLAIELDRLEARRTSVINPLRAAAGMSEIPALPMVVPAEVKKWYKLGEKPIQITPRPLAAGEPVTPALAPAAEPEQPATFDQYLGTAATPLKPADRTFLKAEGWSDEMINKLNEAIMRRLLQEE